MITNQLILYPEVKKSDLSAASTWIGDRRSSWIGHRWSKLLFFQNGSGIVDLSYFCCFENGAKSKHYLTTANRRKISLKKLFKKIFEVKTIEDLIWCGFFWKAIWIKKRKRQKCKARILGETHEPYFTLPRIFGETKNLYGKLKERIMGEAGK